VNERNKILSEDKIRMMMIKIIKEDPKGPSFLLSTFLLTAQQIVYSTEQTLSSQINKCLWEDVPGGNPDSANHLHVYTSGKLQAG
jgi:hypothetical protein